MTVEPSGMTNEIGSTAVAVDDTCGTRIVGTSAAATTTSAASIPTQIAVRIAALRVKITRRAKRSAVSRGRTDALWCVAHSWKATGVGRGLVAAADATH